MKNIAAILFLLLAGLSAAVSITVTGPLLKTDLAKYDPYPAESGKFLTLWITAQNIGGNVAENVEFTLKPEYPLRLINEENKSYSSIRAGNDVLLEYRFIVDEDAPDGLANMDFRYSINGGGVFVKKFNITVEKQKNQSDLRALFVETDPIASPGSKTSLSIDVANAASGTAYYVIARAETPAGKITRDKIYIGNLEPDDFDSVDFDIELGNVAPGTYPVNIIFEYKDKDDNVHAANDTVYMKVVSADELKPAGDGGSSLFLYAMYLTIAGTLIKFVVLPLRRRKK
ncbi:MAG: hypothetical protein HY364_01080 [Candidatus Aenigmarchaeota archaeon]|nr:hypothetical protein [Candidatus Aenigmarchaeota archaeon]